MLPLCWQWSAEATSWLAERSANWRRKLSNIFFVIKADGQRSIGDDAGTLPGRSLTPSMARQAPQNDCSNRAAGGSVVKSSSRGDIIFVRSSVALNKSITPRKFIFDGSYAFHFDAIIGAGLAGSRAALIRRDLPKMVRHDRMLTRWP